MVASPFLLRLDDGGAILPTFKSPDLPVFQIAGSVGVVADDGELRPHNRPRLSMVPSLKSPASHQYGPSASMLTTLG